MIVAYGDAIVDLFATPRGADVATAESFVPFGGGAPANVARVAARLGARVRFVGAVGQDAHGDRLVAQLADDGVDVASIVRVTERTGVTFVRVGLDGSRAFLSYRHGGADVALSPAHLAPRLEGALRDARWLHLTTSSMLIEPLASSTQLLLAAADERGVAVSLDLNVRAHLWNDPPRMERAVRALAQRAAMVKASEEDLAALGLDATPDALASLAPRARATVLTLAERGALARIGGHEVQVESPRVDVVDCTGAGDAFDGALLASLDQHGLDADGFATLPRTDAVAMLTRACAMGARAVTALGATEALRAAGKTP